jgi:transporter family protein
MGWLLLSVVSAVAAGISIGEATRVTAIDKASLVVTTGLAVVFLGERLSWKAALGVLLIVAGSILASAGK